MKHGHNVCMLLHDLGITVRFSRHPVWLMQQCLPFTYPTLQYVSH